MDCWITTYTGRRINLSAPKPSHVSIVDIAAGLSHTCRFAGQTRPMYTVAQHSVMVSRCVPDEYARWGLMHDAAEAYLGDPATPVRMLCPDLHAFEKRLCADLLRLSGLDPVVPECVKAADVRAAATEARDVMTELQHLIDPEGPGRILYLPKYNVPPYLARLEAWKPRRAWREFLERWCETFGGNHPWRQEAEDWLYVYALSIDSSLEATG